MHQARPLIYDLVGHVFFAGRRRTVYRRLAPLSRTRAADRVVDVCCGTGYFRRILAAAVGPAGQVVGIDPSGEALVWARRLTRLATCSYDEGEAEHLDLEDATVDIAVSTLAIHHVPEDHRPLALAEMFRVLRPAGRILVRRLLCTYEFAPPAPDPPRQEPAIERNPVHRLAPMLRQTGFEDVVEGDVKPSIRYARGSKPRSVLGAPDSSSFLARACTMRSAAMVQQ